MTNEVPRFVVARVDRRGELATTYLQHFALAGRNGLRGLGFGPAAAAHLFARHAEAEAVARKLRRRLADAEYEYRTEEVLAEPSPRPAAFHWQ